MEIKHSFSGTILCDWQNMMVQPPQAHNYGIYDNNGKDWYFGLYNDYKMRSYKYISSVILTWMNMLNTYIPIHCKNRKKAIMRANYILEYYRHNMLNKHLLTPLDPSFTIYIQSMSACLYGNDDERE